MGAVAGADLDASIVERSHEWCERGLRHMSTSFFLGMRLARADKRRGLYALYRWMRQADDIADTTLDHDEPGETWRKDTHDALEEFWTQTLHARQRRDELWPAFAWTCERFGIRETWLRELIEGMISDAHHAPFETMTQLDTYCHQVAGTVGMCCTAIFGVRAGADRDDALAHAEQLGRAFQIINILRDLPGDLSVFACPRCYVPRELFAKYGLDPVQVSDDRRVMRHDILEWNPARACDALVRDLLARAEVLLASWHELDRMVEPDSRATLWAMQARYRWLFERIKREPRVCVRTPPVRPGVGPKAWIAAQALARRVATIG